MSIVNRCAVGAMQQHFGGQGRMKIRKPLHRHASPRVTSSSPVEDDARPVVQAPLLKVWDCGDGRPKSTTSSTTTSEVGRGCKTTTTETTTTMTATTPVMMEPAWGLESVSTLSRQSPSPGVSMLQQRGHASDPWRPKSEPQAVAQLNCNRMVDDAEDGSNLSSDPLWQTQDDGEEEHAPRHYVRRSNVVAARKGDDDDAPALIQFEPSGVAARMSTLEINGNGEIKQGESEKLPSPAIGASKCKLKPEDSETDNSEDREETHPSLAPEGSLLHTLYLQLLAAGSEGITLRELFASFKKQTALPNLAMDWKERVRSHLKNNPHFDEVKGHYLLCDQLVQQRPKRPYKCVSPTTTNTSGLRHMPSLRTTTVQYPDSAPAALQPFLSMEKHEGVQTRRKAYEKTIEAVLTQSAMEYKKVQQQQQQQQQQSMGNNMQMASMVSPRAGDPTDSQITHTPPPTSTKRKSSSDSEELDGFRTFRGSLQAMQAKILAETGVQKGVPCARKDDARKWRCPLVAMEDHTLCEHHRTLQLRKRVRKQEESNKSRRSSMEEETGAGRLKSDLFAGEAETCSDSEKDDIVSGLGGAHAVEALMDLQGGRRIVTLSTFEAESVMEDDPAPDPVEEEAQFKPSINNHFTKNVHTVPSSVVYRNLHYEKAIPGSLKALQAKILAESGGVIRSGVRCARKDGSNDSARKWQCPLDAIEGHTLCEHHNFLKERKKARYAAGKQMKAGSKRRRRKDMGLPVRHTQFDEVPTTSLPPRSERPVTSSEKDVDEKLSESTDTDDDYNVDPPGKGNSKDDDDDGDGNSNVEQLLLPHSFQTPPKRLYVAAKKNAATVDVVKENPQGRESSPLTRPPTIPPLPAMYGVRRKAVKNRSLLSL